MTIPSLNTIREGLTALPELEFVQGMAGQAAVLVPLVKRDNHWHVLLTRRADSLRHHSGEVAFPGGMWEEGDRFPIDTALRESHEEIGLAQEQVELLGMLEEVQTRRLTRVRPIVACIPDNIPFVLNSDEIASIFMVPIEFFLSDQRLRTDVFKRGDNGQTIYHWVPAYQYDSYEIWGFTAAVIVKLLNRCFQAKLSREHSAPEKIW